MTKRKTLLLIILGCLVAVFVLQIAFSRRGRAETLELAKAPDRIEVSSIENGAFALVKAAPDPDNESQGWVIEEGGFAADPSSVRRMLNSLNSLKLLSAVSSDVESANFGLDGESAVTVEAFAGGQSLRRVKIGKASATGSQTYAVVDGGGRVQLVSGNIRDAFNRTADAIRDRRIFSLDQGQIVRIEAANAYGEFALERRGEPAAWHIASSGALGGIAADTEKTAAWVSSVLTLTAAGFEDESVNLPETPAGNVTFTLQADETGAPRLVTLNLYAPDEAGGEYLAASSECKQAFRVSSYTAERYLKDAADFAPGAE